MEHYLEDSLSNTIKNLILDKEYDKAENLLKNSDTNTSEYHYLYGILLQKKSWFESALSHMKLAVKLSPENSVYTDSLISLMGRHRRYSDDYYDSGYRRRNRGSSCCCCCDDCCDCGNFSCCDLICLDQCCECMGGDLIDCI